MPRRPSPTRAPVDRLAAAVAPAFGAVSALRRARGLHPRGVVLAGTATVAPAGRALASAPSPPAVVRLSRGIGLPSPLPDFNGVAVRLVDAHGAGRHQDLLLTTAGSSPGLRHVLVPVPTFRTVGARSVLPYRSGGRLVVLGADPLPVRGTADAAAHLPLRLTVRVASLLGPWRLAAELELTELVEGPAADAVRFDPWRTGPDLVPAGVLNRLRRPAYAASRAGWPGPR